jgi:hypothetical protein
MSRREESIPYMLVHDVPWWVSVALAGVVYVVMSFVAPTLWQDNPVMKDIMKAMPSCAGLAAMFLLCLAGLNLYVRGLKWISHRPRVTKTPDGRRDEKGGTDAVLACPACGGTMVDRTARRGANPGARFWGCARYPACGGTRPA